MDKWRCLAKFGHQGSGNYFEKVIEVKADIFQAQRKARYFPGVKSVKNKKYQCVNSEKAGLVSLIGNPVAKSSLEEK